MVLSNFIIVWTKHCETCLFTKHVYSQNIVNQVYLQVRLRYILPKVLRAAIRNICYLQCLKVCFVHRRSNLVHCCCSQRHFRSCRSFSLEQFAQSMGRNGILLESFDRYWYRRMCILQTQWWYRFLASSYTLKILLTFLVALRQIGHTPPSSMTLHIQITIRVHRLFSSSTINANHYLPPTNYNR